MATTQRVIQKLILRDAVSALVVAFFMFPIVWWALISIKPQSAIYDKDKVNVIDFTPTLANYKLTLFARDNPVFFAGQSILDTFIVSASATFLTLIIALITSFALWHFTSSQRKLSTRVLLIAWMVPSITVLIPLFQAYYAVGLFDTHLGLILAHTALHLPFATLLLKSFFDDVPREVAEAAAIDGASAVQIFTRIVAPLISGGISATAVLCFIFSWTEFVMAVFLTNSIRLLSVQLSISQTATWGFVSALGTAAMLPAFITILIVRRHLVRGLTLGFYQTR